MRRVLGREKGKGFTMNVQVDEINVNPGSNNDLGKRG